MNSPLAYIGGKSKLSETIIKMIPDHQAYCEVFAGAAWQDFIKRYDRTQTFFYCDPPYYKAPFYEHNLELDDYHELAAILADIKGKFILSINDRSEMRKAFRDFNIKPVELKYTVALKQQTKAKELLIYNFQ